MKIKKSYIISLGGSLIAPQSGIDAGFLKKFKKLLLEQTKKGQKFYLITGGGVTCRYYQNSAKKIANISNNDLDWIGIYASRLNANLVRSIFGSSAYERIIEDPNEKVKTSKKVIVGAGWKPGWSTDYVATLLAGNNNIDTVINLSNIDYAYDKDPKKNKNAKKLKNIKWKDFRKIVGSKWTPGLSMPFDPIASRKAEQLGLRVIVCNGKNLLNLKKCLEDDTFKGTVIE